MAAPTELHDIKTVHFLQIVRLYKALGLEFIKLSFLRLHRSQLFVAKSVGN